MSLAAVSETSGVLASYRTRVRDGLREASHGADELVTPEGVRGDNEALAGTIEAMGLAGLLAARAETRHFVEDEGITYGSSAPGRRARVWSIDPIPLLIGATEWGRLQRGLAQRSRLLDLVLADIYGDRTLLRRRIIPPEIVLAHEGFVRQTDRIAGPGKRQLVLAAADLGRDATGAWQVISDRTQAPSGAGYAMATRRVVSRVMAGLHRGTDLARLRGFFNIMTAALQDASPASVEPPRVVLLSPGANSETAFEHGFLASLLGFPVVEADDLVMRQGKVWLRAGDRLEQVDVVLRRVDASFSDPLELRGDSQLGVPGLIEATRNRTVAVANPVGAGVLENPALMAYLPAAAQALLGEELLLEGATTWWCGDPAARSHVLAHLGSLVVKPISRENGTATYGWQLAAKDRAALAARITAAPWAWVAQEPMAMSTAPVVTRSGLEPRRFVLRTFGVAHAGDYHFLPGGLGRVAGHIGQYTVSNYTGALAKDVWVLSAEAGELGGAGRDRRLNLQPTARASGLAPRVADNLYWMGRYAERAEGTSRLIKVADDFAEDHSSRPSTPGAAAMKALLHAVAMVTYTGAIDQQRPVDYLRHRVLDGHHRGTVVHCAAQLVEAAQHIRDLLSVDTWSVLSRLQRTLAEIPDVDHQLQPQLADVLESLLALAGIIAHSMVRDESWAFLDAGSRMERAQLTVALLRNTIVRPRPRAVDGLVVEGVLRAGESIITHRRRAAAGTGPSAPVESAIDLLLFDRINPRAVIYQLDSLAADLRVIGDEVSATRAAELSARLGVVDIGALQEENREPLARLLADLESDLRALNDAIGSRHFVRQAPRHAQTSEWATPWQVT